MKNYSLLLALFLLLSACSNNTQNGSIPILSNTEMEEDIDFLYQTIIAVNPHLAIRQQATKTNLYEELDSLRRCSNTLKSFEDFYYLAARMLLLCQDQHIGLQSFYPEGIENHNSYISAKAVAVSEACELRYDKYSVFDSEDIIYINGDYFFAENTYNTQSKEILLPVSAKLLKVNNIPIDDYISKWNRKVDNSTRWDFEKQKYYTYRLYPPNITDLSKDFNITFQVDSVIRTVDMNILRFMKGWLCKDYFEPKVLYFQKTNILYIRLPDMNTEDINYYLENIQQYKNQSIQKIIIDIRYNYGGNDEVWLALLSAIIDKPIICENKVYLKNTPLVIDYMNNIRKTKITHSQIDTFNIGNNDYIDISGNDTIVPLKESIQYTGKIYVLVNEKCFSSALAFTAICNRTNKFITVGQPSNYIGGRGISPFFFTLPHSKLIFTVIPMLDATDVESIGDYYDRFVQVPVMLTINDYMFERSYEGERYSEEFLFNHDPVFQKVLEQKD
ncbi:MAG: S41 family peptidase [Bacteroidales bacterium]|nr:S41 family peptidase [Bacteroidales bacterium]